MTTVGAVGRNCIVAGQALCAPAEYVSKGVIRTFFTKTTPGRNDNCDSEVCEYVRRTLTVICFHSWAFPTSLGFMAAGKAVMMVGDYLTGENYFYIQGNLDKEIQDEGRLTVMSFNTCSLPGGLPWLDGLPPERAREDLNVAIILEKQPMIACLQEVSFGSQIPEKLSAEYPHVYTRIGHPDFTTLESCLCVASKVPIIQAFFRPFPNEKGISRGIFCLETKNAWVITTHLMSGETDADKAKRVEELAFVRGQITAIGDNCFKPVIFTGDMNISDPAEYETSDLWDGYYDPRSDGDRPDKITRETATCTNQFKEHARGIPANPDLELDDYMTYALYNGERIPQIASATVQRVDVFDDPKVPNAKTASDHHALYGEFTFEDLA